MTEPGEPLLKKMKVEDVEAEARDGEFTNVASEGSDKDVIGAVDAPIIKSDIKVELLQTEPAVTPSEVIVSVSVEPELIVAVEKVIEEKLPIIKSEPDASVNEADLIGVQGTEWREDEDDDYDDGNSSDDEDSGHSVLHLAEMTKAVFKKVVFYCDQEGFVHVYCDQYNHYQEPRYSRRRSAIGCWWGPNHPKNVGRLSQVETFTRPRATLESEVLAVQIALEHGIKKLVLHTNFLYGKRSITKFIKMWEAKAEEQGQKGKWMTVSNGTRPYNEDLIEELKRSTDSLEAVKWNYVKKDEWNHGCKGAKLLARNAFLKSY